MTPVHHKLIDYLEHIVAAISRIEHYTAGLDRQTFLENELVQDAVVRNLEVVGEASRNIQRHHPTFIDSHADIPLSLAYEMRNVLSHGYFSVDFQIVWETLQNDLPKLSKQISQVVQDLR